MTLFDMQRATVLSVDIQNKGLSGLQKGDNAFVNLSINFGQGLRRNMELQIVAVVEDNFSENETLRYRQANETFPHK